MLQQISLSCLDWCVQDCNFGVSSWIMTKTFEIPIDVLEIQFHFENAKMYWTWFRRWNSVVKSCFWSSQKNVGISKMKLDFLNIDWKFRSLLEHSTKICTSGDCTSGGSPVWTNLAWNFKSKPTLCMLRSTSLVDNRFKCRRLNSALRWQRLIHGMGPGINTTQHGI